MKYCNLIIVLFAFTTSISSQAQSSSKVESLDSILYHLYDVISGEKGQERDWKFMRSLFVSGAQLIPVRENAEGRMTSTSMSVEDYIQNAGPYLIENGFFEKEIHRTIDQFGNIAQVFSTYESYHSEKEIKPFARGINSIQLLFDNNRWWIVNIYWQNETNDSPIPSRYLPN